VTHGVGRARQSQGYVTSSYFSPSLGRPIALGLVEAGLSRMGETVRLYHLGAERRATITTPVVLDPEGARLHA
jgi:sarcosine oxidase subunit alpha